MGWADELMHKYSRSDVHWIRNYLGVEASIASLVRSYLMPPPVFYLEPGDLVVDLANQKYSGVLGLALGSRLSSQGCCFQCRGRIASLLNCSETTRQLLIYDECYCL